LKIIYDKEWKKKNKKNKEDLEENFVFLLWVFILNSTHFYYVRSIRKLEHEKYIIEKEHLFIWL